MGLDNDPVIALIVLQPDRVFIFVFYLSHIFILSILHSAYSIRCTVFNSSFPSLFKETYLGDYHIMKPKILKVEITSHQSFQSSAITTKKRYLELATREALVCEKFTTALKQKSISASFWKI